MSAKKQGRPRSSSKHPQFIMLDKVPPYVWYNSSGQGKWMQKYFDNDLSKWRSRKLCSSKATLAQIWNAFENTKKQTQTQVTFLTLSLEYQQSKYWKAYSQTTRDDYLGCHRWICKTRTSTKELLGDLPISVWTKPFARKYFDHRELKAPSRANHEIAYVKAVCKWAMEYGKIKENFAEDLRKSKEEPVQRNPSDKDYEALLKVARESVYDYMAPAMELAYLCKMRLIEVFELTDAHCTAEGLLVERHKGSRDTIVEWNDRLSDAVDILVSRRDEIFAKRKKSLPANSEERFLFYSKKTGRRIEKSSFKTAMARIKKMAKEQNPEFVEFCFHDLKRKGVSDTKGSAEDKLKASGHRSPQMLKIYDKEIAVVKPTKD